MAGLYILMKNKIAGSDAPQSDLDSSENNEIEGLHPYLVAEYIRIAIE